MIKKNKKKLLAILGGVIGTATITAGVALGVVLSKKKDDEHKDYYYTFESLRDEDGELIKYENPIFIRICNSSKMRCII